MRWTWRQILFQLHWLAGITAGTLLAVIGVSGALLAYRAEITEALNPALFHRAAPTAGAVPLTPAGLAAALRARDPQAQVQTITLRATPGWPVRVGLAAAAGQRRGVQHWLDPWTAEVLPEPRGDEAFETLESLHRWLLLPRDIGKPVTGVLAAALLLLAVSGLVLRWPRRTLDWRAWLRVDFRLRGRALLWNLHAVAGTFALLCYLVSGLTGVYWGFDAVRAAVDGAVGEGQAARMQRSGGAQAARVTAAPATAPTADTSAASTPPPAARTAADLDALWQGFLRASNGDWQLVTLRLPARANPRVEVTYLRRDAEHDRARNRLYLDAATGAVAEHRRYAELSAPARLVNSIYPLHMGSFWGPVGRVVMVLASAGLLLFAVTGWLLYLRRRREAAAARQARRASLAATGGHAASGASGLLIAFATQTGHAERLAWQTAAALGAAGVPATVQPLHALAPADLSLHPRVLIVASSYGDGEPPDTARAFARRVAAMTTPLQPAPAFGLLALGNRQYGTFCGFGHALEVHLRRLGARPLFPLVEMDEADPAALAQWRAHVGAAFGVALDDTAAVPALAEADWLPSELLQRAHLNPGSAGSPLFALQLALPAGSDWHAGALVEIEAPVAGEPPRRYSAASVPADGELLLLVRQRVLDDGGLGLMSSWLTVQTLPGAPLRLRLVDNPGFRLIDDDRPCLFIGNGSGFAGLRGHLRERVGRGHGRNWLVFGERHPDHDAFFADEVQDWQARGLLARVDLAWSRLPPAGRHVQDALRDAGDELRRWVDDGAVVYVCGSLAGMARGVDAALRELLGGAAVEALLMEGRLRRDVY